ncbi:hypothetical protein [Polynucleobacter sp. UK-Gri1-W3]|uniref:hypothetical protein n=1 Tax=Polynucleobacter sp. UK-Gri1-W3 TaxID=1819737 RepID=UPI001C0C1D91|nr:hypothetical protein [Polynucleobacter sp. UK-Gri1-W3]MBU3537355.1 hypothetical protein [Polynucleobacter sp. UK-Gri1-W3]
MPNFTGNHLNIVKYAPLIFFASAIFGLSALVLGFTFSGANEHFDKRISLIRAQADAITQVYQSSKYLNPRDQNEVHKSLKEILADRLAMFQEVNTFDALNANITRLGDKLNEFNELMMLSIPRAPIGNRELADKILRPQADNLMEVLRDGMLNARHHPPVILERFLFALLSIGALLSGYAMAVKNEEDWFLTFISLGLMGFALYVIFALEFPNELFPYETFNADLLRAQTLMQ